MKKPSNVIKFPKQSVRPKPLTKEQIDYSLEVVDHYHVQETLDKILPSLFNQLEIAGFDINDEDEFDNDEVNGIMIIESVRALLCKKKGMYHPFQKIASKVFVQEKDYYKIVDKLNISMKEPKKQKEVN